VSKYWTLASSTARNAVIHATICSQRVKDSEKALIKQRFRDPEASPHNSVFWEQTKLRLMAPFER
jgi:hypothetical protein